MRHVRTESGVKTFHKPIGSPIGGGSPTHKLAPHETIKSSMDDQARTLRSVAAQTRAQQHASAWFDKIENDWNPSEADVSAAQFWYEYQVPNEYGNINTTLRTGKPPQKSIDQLMHEAAILKSMPDAELPEPPTRAEIMADVNRMFKEAGTKTTEPISVYRALRAENHDWATQFEPGTVFEDRGMVSTTAQPQYAQGWLMLDGTDDGKTHIPGPRSVVMEIRVPPGRTIVGGNPGFIETMLHPDSKFKIISKEVRTAKAESPLEPEGRAPVVSFPYTHVIAELV